MASESLEKLIKQINDFDLYYEMSDSYNIITNGTNKEKIINFCLKSLTQEDLVLIYANLNLNGQNCWNRYFKKIVKL